MSEDTAYFESLPEELKAARFFKPGEDGAVKPISQLISDLDDAGKWMGNSVRIPGPDASDDDVASFRAKVMEKIPGLTAVPNLEDPEVMAAHFTKLGRPETADSYKAPDNVQLEGEQLGQLKALAFKANMTQAQFNDYVTNMTAAQADAVQQQQLKHEEGIATLKSEWGAAYDENVAQITALLKTNTTTPPYLIEQLQQGNLPADQVRWLHSIADAVSNEDGQFHQQGGNDTAQMMTPEEAGMRANEVTAKMLNRDKPPSPEEMKVLEKKAEAYEYMARGMKPPGELLRYIQ